ncbi:MAG TPA: hypothetical protein VH253_10125 [Phycisphaerae bacterium]|nr:hypothetical protein [Phycisphaerae bacterium]
MNRSFASAGVSVASSGNGPLDEALDRVAARELRVNRLWQWAILCAAAAAALGGVGLEYARVNGAMGGLLAAAAGVGAAGVLQARRAALRDRVRLARRLEGKYPDLDTRLLAALGQAHPGQPEAPKGYLRQVLVDQTLSHAREKRWEGLVSPSRMAVARGGQLAGVGLLLAAGIFAGLEMSHRGLTPPTKPTAGVVPAFDIKVEPADTQIERNTPLLVLARFGGKQLPANVTLLTRDAAGHVSEAPSQIPMTKSLDDPLFAGRVESVGGDLSYAVKYGDQQTRWYKATVFDYPDLKQADARLKYPDYTKLPEKTIEDTRSVTAVEGTKATLSFHLNKPVAEATLVPNPRGAAATQPAATLPAAVALTADPKDPTLYSVSLDMKQSEQFKLQLVDADHRANREPALVTLNVTENKPPDLKMVFPGHDVDVSPLQEMTLRASVWDDFGVKRVGITYGIAGQEEHDVVLGENLTSKDSKDRKEVAAPISMEQLRAQPDQLLAYHFWAEDVGPDGKTRRTSGDMFFAEVRPFEEIFRQGQQPTAEQEAEQQRQQQQGQQAGAQNGQRAEQLADTEKQLIAATWKVIRREEPLSSPSAAFGSDVKLLVETQNAAREQAGAMGQRLTDDKSRGYLDSVLKDMSEAADHLREAADSNAEKPLAAALNSEQAAYQDLLKLRSREFEVVRSNRQQGQQSASSAESRRQQQLNQLDLNQEQNRYETQRTAQQQAQQQTDSKQQQETRQVLSRLRELAQRQEEINQQMKDLQAALQKARDQQQREDLQRQLARLRDQQQELLRDTDALRDRMDQPENQEQMANARQQLEQTRENVRQAADDLNRQQVAQAQAAGERAQEQLSNLRDQVREQAAGQFTDAMNQMREQAQQLDEQQQDLTQQLAKADQAATQPAPGLRDNSQAERQQLAGALDDQKKQLGALTDNMKKTIEQAETPEPLLAKQLYDTLRQSAQQAPDKALDTSKQMVNQGLLPEARQSSSDAGQAISQLRQGIDKASQSVLANDTESLRRARAEVDQLAQQLGQPGGARQGNAATRPANQVAGGGQAQRGAMTQPAFAGGGSATQPALAGAATQPGMARGGAATQPGDVQVAQAGGNPRDIDPRSGQPRTQPNGVSQANGGARANDQQNGAAGERQTAQGGQQNGQTGERQTAQNGQHPGQTGERQTAQAGQNGQPQNGQTGERQTAQTGQRGGRQGAAQNGDQQSAQANAGGRQGQQPGQANQPGQQAGQQPGEQNGQQANAGQRGDRQGAAGRQPGEQANAGERGQQPGQQPGQEGQGQQPGEQGDQQANADGRGGRQPGQGQQPGEEGQQANAGQRGGGRGQGQQPGEQGQQANAGARGQRGGQPGQQPGEGQQPGQGQQQANAGGRGGRQPGQPGQGQPGQRGDQQPTDQQANAQQPGQPGQGGQRGGQPGQRGARGGQNPALAQGQQPGQPGQPGQQPNQRIQPNQPGQPGAGNANPQQDQTASAIPTIPPFVESPSPATRPGARVRSGGGAQQASADPITGDGFREWTDRMRDVEEMVNDPQLRAQAAAIREKMAALRAQYKNDQQAPSWKEVDENIAQPLAQLRDAISTELLRRDSADARVPIDKEPVPAGYADEVRRYYERLGSGK